MNYRILTLQRIAYRGGVFEADTELIATDAQLGTIALWVRNGLAEPLDDETAAAVAWFDDHVLAARAAATLH